MPALIINPRSGGGKATRFDLIAQCAKRGIEPIVLEPGDDLAALAGAHADPVTAALRRDPDTATRLLQDHLRHTATLALGPSKPVQAKSPAR